MTARSLTCVLLITCESEVERGFPGHGPRCQLHGELTAGGQGHLRGQQG